jgi:hypothetical protein
MKLSRDSYLLTIQSSQGLSDAEKQDCKDGWNTFINLLGEQWLDTIKDNHPFLFWITNQCPWAIRRVSDLGKKLFELQTYDRFETLLRSFKHLSQCSEALSEIEIFSRLKRKGFNIELYPLLPSGGKADVKATKDQKEFWWEVTTTMESGYEKNARRTWFSLYRPPNGGVNVRFKIYRSLSNKDIITFNKLIDQKISEAKTSDGYREIRIPGVMDYYIATDDRFHCIPEDMQGILSIPLGVDPSKRVINKISNELQQLPSNKPGVIALFNDFLWPEDLDCDLIRRIHETIEPYKHVCCVFITVGKIELGEECEMEFEDHKLIQLIRYDAILERTFVISNPAYEVDQLMEIFR